MVKTVPLSVIYGLHKTETDEEHQSRLCPLTHLQIANKIHWKQRQNGIGRAVESWPQLDTTVHGQID